MTLFCLANVTGAVKIAGIEWSVLCSGCNLILKIYIIPPSEFQPATDKSASMDELSIWQIDLVTTTKQNGSVLTVHKLYFPIGN